MLQFCNSLTYMSALVCLKVQPFSQATVFVLFSLVASQMKFRFEIFFFVFCSVSHFGTLSYIYLSSHFDMKSQFLSSSIVLGCIGALFTWVLCLKIQKEQQINKSTQYICLKIAELDLDGPEIENLLSKDEFFAQEVEISLARIVRIMKEFKKFLPSSLYKNEIAIANENTLIEEAKNSDGESSGEYSSSTNSNDSNEDKEISSDNRNQRLISKKKSKKKLEEISIVNTLEKRNAVSLMCVEIIGFSKVLKNIKIKEEEILNFFSQFAILVEDNVSKTNGTIESFDGTKIWVSWNTSKISIRHQEHCLLSAIHVSLKFGDLLSKGESSSTLCKSISIENNFRITLTTGKGFCGNIGGKSFLRFTSFGEIREKNEELNHAKNNNEDIIIVCEKYFEEFKYIVDFEAVDITPEKVIIYGIKKDWLLQAKESMEKEKGLEWLYAINSNRIDGEDDQEKKNIQIINNAYEEIRNGQIENARSLVKEMEIRNESNQQLNRLLFHLKQMTEETSTK